jgi:peptide chain release factor subunit 1
MAQFGLDLVRSLAAARAEKPTALSCYLELDPAIIPTATELASQVTSLVAAARHAAEEAGDDRDATATLRADVDRIAHFLADGFDRSGADGLGLFVSAELERWQEVLLPGRVESAVHVGRTFVLAPLLEFLERDRTVIVAGVGRDRGTLWRFRSGRVDELANLGRDGRGQHDQGGWSQARYQRSRDREALDHMRRVAAAIAEHVAPGSRTLVVVATTEELRGAFELLLETHVRKALLGFTQIEKQEGARELVPEVRRMLDARLREERQALLARWREESGQGVGLASESWSEALDASWEGRIEGILVDGRTEAAFECPACGRGYLRTGVCDLDGRTLVPALGGALELVVRGALLHDGEVRWASDGLGQPTGIRTLFRYAALPRTGTTVTDRRH